MMGAPVRRGFRFGVVNERVDPPEAWLKRVRRAEELGYATFLIRDHLVPDFFGDQLAPLPALTAAAAATTPLRVGTMVLANDYRHPAHLAKEAATVDLLSGGRLELGLGAGWLRREYAAAGIPFDPPGVRIDRLAEALRVLKGLFGEEPLDFVGDHYAIAGLDGFPKPRQRPHPPLLVGGGGKRILSLAGREADIVGILTTAVGSGVVVDDPRQQLSAAVAEKVGLVRQGAGERFSAVELSLMPTVVVTDDRRSSTERFIQERGWSGIAVEQVWDMPAVFIGSVDGIAEEMRRRREELGFSYFVVSDREMESVAPIVARLGGS